MTVEDVIGGGTPPPKVLVLGVGNLLLKDDGVGVHVINALRDTSFPDNVQLIDAGTVSHQLISLFHETDYLILVDAVSANDVPGSIYRFSPDDINFQSGYKLSLHEINLIDILQMAELTGAKPEAVIIGIQPKDVSSWSLELSDEVKAVIPKVKDLVVDELKRINALPS
ncbi:MAG TPA: HyaD/HybD family hydrogenase maturation endopeptidase [Dissulfurispiraceae bacterium]|nr:HyaD/HybD family hydrogenase maturation endopeptidase [Dissulfurispiraceae bacterium]